MHPEEHDNFGGLHRDLPRLVDRREALFWLGGASLAAVLAACGVGRSASTTVATTSTTAGTTTTGPSTTTTTGAGAGAGPEIPDETVGPFPADGSNGPNLLDEGDVLRSDLTTSFAGLTGVAVGVPLVMNLTVVDAANGNPLPGAAVYLWHCTAGGRYSVYQETDQNYLRGVQIADAAGRLTFTSVFPGCYPGRWPHAHFEVYPTLGDITVSTSAIKVSQLALPEADCVAVYADSRYGDSAESLSFLSLSTDGVFADGWQDQLAVVTGSVASGYTASLLVRV